MFCSAVFSFAAVHLDSASETLLIENIHSTQT